MQQRRPAKPHDEIDDRAAIDDLGERVGADRERDEMREQMQRARAVAPGEDRAAHAASNIRLPTHLVQCTPGWAGRITRAGYP